MIALIDYGSGNLRSVQNALRHEGADPVLVANATGFHDADAAAVVLPGVGAFGDCVAGLRARALWAPLEDWLASGKPFLGICVGYHLLFEGSEESPGVAGFGVFAGRVKRFSTPGVKVPQIGWNRLKLTSPPHPLWSGLPPNPHVYFVHSYFPDPHDQSIVTARTEYGEAFAAAVARGNIAGVQFHPEKSQEVGLAILRNFVNACGATAGV